MNLPNPRQDNRLRLGIFGGTFNPIHRGHTQVARDVLRMYRLTRICFIPCASPPHKTEKGLAEAKDRYQMVSSALAGESDLVVSDVEIKRSGPSYTIDTLHHFRRQEAQGMELFFILGLDAFLEIHTWKSYCDMFRLAAFIVMGRPQTEPSTQPWTTKAVDFARRRISGDYMLAASGDVLMHPRNEPIHLALVTPVPISSSQLRKMIRQEHPYKDWVDPSVAAFIERKGLYR